MSSNYENIEMKTKRKFKPETVFLIVMVVLSAIVCIIAVALITSMYLQNYGIFAIYQSPEPPSSAVFPMGQITYLSPDEVEKRNEFYQTGSYPQD